MLTLYRWLLRLYPAEYLREYGEEMVSVFSSAEDALRRGRAGARAAFYARELRGAVRGALREHFSDFRRFGMRKEFRFPRSAIYMMLLILATVIVAINKGQELAFEAAGIESLPSAWSILPGLFLTLLVVMGVLGVAGYAVRVLLKRSGSQRLSGIRTWPQGR